MVAIRSSSVLGFTREKEAGTGIINMSFLFFQQERPSDEVMDMPPPRASPPAAAALQWDDIFESGGLSS